MAELSGAKPGSANSEPESKLFKHPALTSGFGHGTPGYVLVDRASPH